MSRWLAAAAVVALSVAPAAAHANPGGPPSKTLERAIKLYEKADYLSASIELYKVTQGETGDDLPNRERAEFYQAKTLFNLTWPAASLAILERIAMDPGHGYRAPAAKWILGVLREVGPWSGAQSLLSSFDDSELQALDELGDQLFLARGRELLAIGEFDAAEATLLAVPAASPLAAAAQLELARVHFRRVDLPRGIAASLAAAESPALAALATHELAFWTRILSEPARATAALTQLAAADSPAAPWATLERSRLAVEGPSPTVELRALSVDTFDALAVALVCTDGPVDDFIRAATPLERAAAESITRWLVIEDNSELFDAVAPILSEPTAEAAVIRLALGPPAHQGAIGWQAEVARELASLAAVDAAWRTTAIAAEVETDLTLREALARAEAGQWLRDRLEAIGTELARFEALTPVFAAGREPGRPGLVVTSALCAAAGVASTGATASPPAITPPPAPRAAKGCAGCAAGTTADAGVGIGVVALILLRGRRRRRRRGDHGKMPRSL